MGLVNESEEGRVQPDLQPDDRGAREGMFGEYCHVSITDHRTDCLVHVGHSVISVSSRAELKTSLEIMRLEHEILSLQVLIDGLAASSVITMPGQSGMGAYFALIDKQRQDLLETKAAKEHQVFQLREKLQSEAANVPIIESAFPFVDLRWEELAIDFSSDTSVRVRARDKLKVFTFAEMGFKDGRKGDVPNSRWAILRDGFAGNHGQISWTDSAVDSKQRGVLKAAVKEIRQKLKSFFGINEDPFHTYSAKKGYRTKFSLRDGRRGIA
jgi:hypothetical protein